MVAQALAHVERLGEQSRDSTHGRTFECRQARAPGPWSAGAHSCALNDVWSPTWPAAARAGSLRRQMTDQPFTAPESLDDVRKYIDENDIEFLFAQFVDMHGKPNAKLVPATHLDGLIEDGAGSPGFAAGDDRPAPERPRPRGDARRALLHAAAVAAGRGAHRVRRPRGGRGVALLPAHDPAPPARARALARLRVQDRRRARVLPRAQARGRLDRAGRPARHARPALLRHARR